MSRYSTKCKWRSIESDNANLMAFDGISPINSAFSGRRRMGIPPFEPAHRVESNCCIPILLRPLDAELIDEMPSFLSFSVLRHLTFCQISRLPVVIGEWENHHSTLLDELVRMVVFPFFYDHWRPRYSTKRYQIGLFI